MGQRTISEEQKRVMADGRRQTRIVQNYLQHVEDKANRGRRISPAELSAELAALESELETASGIERLELLQRREDLQRLALEVEPEDDGALEEQFIAVAKAYADRKGVSYSTWREFGVEKTVLEAAGIRRTRRPNSPTSN